MDTQSKPKICVIGAGIIGLSTALCLTEQLPGCDVTVISDQTGHGTTSDGAAGLFNPSGDILGLTGTDVTLLKSWLLDSFTWFDAIWKSRDAPGAGVSVIHGYEFFNGDRQKPLYADVVYNFRHCTDKEIQTFGSLYSKGFAVTTLLIEPRFYLPWLTQRLEKAGVKIANRRVGSLDELTGNYNVIMNCSGLRSRELVGDTKLFPVRGQMIRMKAPWVKYFVFGGSDRYIIPGMETAAVSGLRKKDDFRLEQDAEEQDIVRRNAQTLVPSILEAKEEWTWVGLRPHRHPIRVEAEICTGKRGSYQVVHNYGHGANGVSLSWGCAVHATRLVGEILGKKPEFRSRDLVAKL